MAFGQELKDFVSAFQAGQKAFDPDEREYKRMRNRLAKAQVTKAEDPELQALDKRKAKAAVGESEARAKYYREYNDKDGALEENRKKQGLILDENLKRLKKLNEPSPEDPDVKGIKDFTNPGAPATPPSVPARTGALPLDDDYSVADNSSADDTGATGDTGSSNTAGAIPDDEPTQFASRGGAIRSLAKPAKGYAEGGLVTDDSEDDDDDDDEDNSTANTTAQRLSYSAAHDAVRDGLSYNVAQYMPSGSRAAINGADPSRQAGMRAYMQGQGAASPAMMAEVYKAVDPKGELPESERNLKALGTVYAYYMSKNNMPAAKKAAGEMLQHYRLASQRYAAFAAAADAHGEPDEAARLAMKAYANIPDGRQIHIQRRDDGAYTYDYLDGESGKTIAKGVATPQQLAAQAMRVATNGFDQFILQAAGERSSGRGTGTGGGAPKLADRAKAADMISTEADRQGDLPAAADGAPNPIAKPNEMVRGISQDILRSNDIRPDDAMRAAHALFSPSGLSEKLKPTEDGGADMQFGDGRVVHLPRNAYLQAMAERGRLTNAGASQYLGSQMDKRREQQDAEIRRQAEDKRDRAVKPFSDQQRENIRRRSREAVGMQTSAGLPPLRDE